MKKIELYIKHAPTYVYVGLFSFIEILTFKSTSLGPKLFCFFMLLPLYFAPELVAQMADEHGVFMIAQPEFTHWIGTSFRVSVTVILILSAYQVIDRLRTLQPVMRSKTISKETVSEARSCPSTTENESLLDDETKKHHQTSALEYQRTIFALRGMTDAAYCYNHSTPVWKAQQELRDAARQLSDNDITLPHFEALDSYLGGIVDAAKWTIDNTSHEFGFTHGFETADSLAEARGQRPIMEADTPHATLAKEAC